MFVQLQARGACRSMWSHRQATCMKREALLECLEAARAVYGRPWARTSVDIAIEVPPIYDPNHP